MGKVKDKVTMIIQDTINFLVDPDIEFVSLVKHGANQAPFKILKSSDKGGNSMSKVVQAVLVPKSLSEDAVKKALEGHRTDEVQEFETYKSYTQVAREDVVLESLEVTPVEGSEGVYVVSAELLADKKEAAKQVDVMALDGLYMELYAMADVVGGAMRQEHGDSRFRKQTILTAIDNFRTYAEMCLNQAKEYKSIDPVKHTDKVWPLIHKPGEGHVDLNMSAEELKALRKEFDEFKSKSSAVSDAVAAIEAKFGAYATREDFQKFVTEVTEKMARFDAKHASYDEAIGKLAGIEEALNAFKTTLKTQKSYREEPIEKASDKAGTFSGLLFARPTKD